MPKIGFIFPSSHYLHDPFRGVPFTHLQILTVLDEYFGSGVDLRLIDLRGIRREFSIYHISECDIYLYSLYTLDFEEQKALVTTIRRQYPKATHIAGGPHANEFPEESSKIFDSLILRDGERMIIQAVKDFNDRRLQRIYNDPKAVDINVYPHPDRKFLPASVTARRKMMTLKKKPDLSNLISTNTIFSRGCPFRCHFCAILKAREGMPGTRFRKPSLIEGEIEYLKRDYGIQGIVLLDEIAFPLKHANAIAELEAIGRTNIVWRGQCRVDGINPEIASLARQSGCLALGLGVESVWQPSLDIINKRISIERARETIRILKANDIEVRLYLIMGLPGEPENILDLTLDFIKETQPDIVSASLFTIRPGTEIFRYPEKFGINKISTDWSNTMHLHGYDRPRPRLNFEYFENTPWGKSLTADQIVDNYLGLADALDRNNLSSEALNQSALPFDDINPLV